MPKATFPRLALGSLLTACLLAAIFSGLLIYFRAELREEIHRKIIERDAAVLYPVAMQQLAEVANSAPDTPDADKLTSVLRSAQQEGMLAVAVFDAEGNTLRAVPTSLLFVELPVDDYLELTLLKPISRYHPAFPLDRTFAGIEPSQREAPVLEVLLPLHQKGSTKLSGVARYYIDARPLAGELALIDLQNNRQTGTIIGVAILLIGIVVTGAYFGLRRAQRIVAEQNARLVRANFDLSLAAKVSALGQITSHLIHGLQGSVAGLRAVVTNREHTASTNEDWATAAGYTDHIQGMIQEAVSLLADSDAHTSFELTGHELASQIRQRNSVAAKNKGVTLKVNSGFDETLDSHRGGLLCLIANNLVQNALEATAPGRAVTIAFVRENKNVILKVTDEGQGVPDEIRARLFKPGHSTRPGGSGLGLAISNLLAQQIGGTLSLDSSSHSGSTFRLTVPLTA